MINFGVALTFGIVGLIWPTITAIKQKHYVRRDDAVFCGLSLILIAIGLIVGRPELILWQLPLYAYPLIHGLLAVGLVVKREDMGLTIGSGWATAVMGAIVLIVQISS